MGYFTLMDYEREDRFALTQALLAMGRCPHCRQEVLPMPYVYVQSEPTLWTVGHYDPQGKWVSESDHASPEAAATRVHYLNGGRND